MASTTTVTQSPCCRRRREEPVPLAVWPVAQQTAQRQRAGRYDPGSVAHPGKMLPALARRIVAEYSKEGDLVCDPLCGIGTTLVEAASLGRRAVGLELEPGWARLARANLRSALDPKHRRLAEVRQGDATALPGRLGDLAGRVDLVCTSPPYACDAGVIDKPGWLAGRRLCPPHSLNYSTDSGNLGHARGERYADQMGAVYAGCFRLLRPGGVLAVVTKNTRRGGRLLDLAVLTVELGRRAGFTYLGHVIALHAAIRDGALVGRPSYWQLSAVRAARARGEPVHLVAHEDVLVLRKEGGDADGR
ncbi:MAG: class I SAM-dependent methyltransferase [Actinomycetota bacterium]|nr:class I SAM-dependent methyltransferase [Actinomycetota bacterium]